MAQKVEAKTIKKPIASKKEEVKKKPLTTKKK
jgi:hypothetical protein